MKMPGTHMGYLFCWRDGGAVPPDPQLKLSSLMSSCGLFHLAEGSWAQNVGVTRVADLRVINVECLVQATECTVSIWNLRSFMHI